MANDKITMLKLKRILQLLDAGKSMNEICRDLHMSKRTVHNYKQRVTSSSVPLAELRRLDDKQLNQLLQPQSPVPKPDERKEALDKELSNYLKEWNKPYVSLLLLWKEYRKAYPNGYQYTQFKKYLNEYDYKKSQEYSDLRKDCRWEQAKGGKPRAQSIKNSHFLVLQIKGKKIHLICFSLLYCWKSV